MSAVAPAPGDPTLMTMRSGGPSMTVTDASTNLDAVETPVGVGDRTSADGPQSAVDELLLDDRAAPAARILARAATAFDSAAMAEVVTGSIRGMGVIATWDRVVCPVLRALGRLPAYTGQEIAVERLLSRAVFEAFACVPRPESVPVRILLACADNEQHTKPLQAVAAAVAESACPAVRSGPRRRHPHCGAPSSGSVPPSPSCGRRQPRPPTRRTYGPCWQRTDAWC